MINNRRAQSLTTRIPIYNLYGGVGRQAANKRLPNEAQNLDNCLISLQRSLEKRPGFELLDGVDSSATYTVPLPNLIGGPTKDWWFYWFTINEDNRYLVCVDYKASTTANLFRIFKVNADGQGYTEIDYTGISVTADALAYITYGNSTYTAREALKAVTLGTQVIILNTKVKAGFSSTDDGSGNYYTFDLDGSQTTTWDLDGPKIQYYTSVGYNTTVNPYVISNSFPTLPVEDLTVSVYPTEPQGLDDFSDLTFPPDTNDWYAVNWLRDPFVAPSTENELPRIVLNRLHDPDHPFYDELAEDEIAIDPDGNNYNLTFPNGRGKIFYCAGPFLTQPSGYYRIVSFEEGKTFNNGGAWGTPAEGKSRPYTQRVRTPDEHSVIDKNRMPHALTLNGSSWSCAAIPWKPRLSGDSQTNPGPSVFTDSDGNAIQSEINAMAVFRSRLWLASRDRVFSSQTNDFENLWIEDPTNISDTDPVDVAASTNEYAEILSMTPFSSYLFINTKGDVQFELTGSENKITPFTAEMSPTTFYSTAPLVNPVLMGSQIYFFAPRRLYLYFSEISASVNSSVEVSEHCPDYLPDNYRVLAVAPPQDMIIAVDDDNPNHVYLYVNKFSGDRVIQNSFFRYILENKEGEDIQVVAARAFENYLYCLVLRAGRYWLERTLLREEDTNIPRLDHYQGVTLTGSNSTFTTTPDRTIFTLPWVDPNIDTVVLGPEFGDQAYTEVEISSILTVGGTSTQITVPGPNYSNSAYPGATVYFGRKFTMTAELSQQFFRNPEGQAVDGLLSLRSILTRHFNTGDYDIVVSRNGRAETTTSFNALSPSAIQDVDDLTLTEEQGELVAKVLAMSDDVSIKIVSNYWTPCNITYIELKGKLKRMYSTVR